MMSNAELVATLAQRNIERITTLMRDRGYSYAEALARARSLSVGGPVVWEKVEAHFAQEGAK